MPVAAIQNRQTTPERASAGPRLAALEPAGPELVCSGDDALASARQLFEGWMRARLHTGLVTGPQGTCRPLPRSAILRVAERAQLPGSSNGESRRLLQLLAERLKALEGISGRAPSHEQAALLLEVSLVVLSLFGKLEAERAALRAAADPLTGLEGRRAMEDRLKQERSRTSREGRHCAVALLDVDHFKRVNDTHGHAVGDRVLVGFAGLLQQSLRTYDGVFRYGGEEFVLCLPGVEAAVAHRMVERIRATVAGTPFETAAGRTFFVTFSAGIAELAPELAPARSLELADAALYRAKSAGRNQVVLAETAATG
jgi:diguanylate cyclase (GGDEF)-like protein